MIADVKDVDLDLPLAELIGRNHVVGGQLANSPQILASGPFNQPGELHVPDHALSEFRHRDTLSCGGTKDSGHSGRKLKGINRSLQKIKRLWIRKNRLEPFPHPAAKPLRPS
jgi:hypothetical protein